MSRRSWMGLALLVFLVLNVVVMVGKSHGENAWPEVLEKDRDQVTQRLSREFRSVPVTEPMFRSYDYFGGVGGLVEGYYWNQILPLAKTQADALKKLDKLLWDARMNSFLADADYMDGNPADYKEYIRRSRARRSATLDQANSMIALGLLTEPQAALVTQRKLSGFQQIPSLLRYCGYVQELLGLTERQKERLAQVGEEGRKERAQLNWFSVDPKEQQAATTTKITAIAQGTDAAVKGILTQRQHEILSRLTAKRTLPAEPPALPALSDAEAARIKLEDLSPTFRVLTNKSDAVGLTVEQKRLLKEFEEVARVGLFHISLGNREGPFLSGDPRNDPDDPIAQTRAEFLKHAEQVALLGILTESQAEQVQAAIK